MKATKGKPVKISMEDVSQRLHWHDSYTDNIHYSSTNRQIVMKLCLCEWLNDEDVLFNGQVGILTFNNVTHYNSNIDITLVSETLYSLEFLDNTSIYVESLLCGVLLTGCVNGIDEKDNYNRCLDTIPSPNSIWQKRAFSVK